MQAKKMLGNLDIIQSELFAFWVNFYMNDHLLARLSNELHLNKCVRINAQCVKDLSKTYFILL